MTFHRRKRVLHILEATLGGTRRYLENIVEASLPYEMGIAYSTGRADNSWEDVLRQMRAKGWATWNVEMSRQVDPAMDLRAARQLKHAMRSWTPDLVHCHSAKAGALGRIANALTSPRRPCVYSPHALPNRLGFQYRAIEHMLAPLATRIVAVTPSERDQILDLRLVSRERIDVVMPAVDTAVYAPRDRHRARVALGLDPARPLVIGIGRLSWQKNPLGFLEILRRAKTAVPELTAIWIGDGELREALIEGIRQVGGERWFSVAGWLDDPREHIAACDALLSVANYESFGYVIPEALAMGRPVIASRVTGTSDTMSHEALKPWLFPLGDVRAASDRVVDAVSSTEMKNVAMVVGPPHVRESFSPSRMSAALNESYERAFANRQVLAAAATVTA